MLLLILFFLGGALSGYYIKKNFFQKVKQTTGRINFLLLGINGNGGGDADLTDTMIFVSVGQDRRVLLLSLPRDLWVNDLQAKLNSAYHYGGIDLAQKTVSEIVGEPIHYYLLIDFKGFEKVIDLAGGVWVEVERSFDDYRYPIAGKEKDLCGGDPSYKCRYEHLHFEAGEQLMDGATALKYVRSRQAEGDEGTDFARARRQQQLLKGLKKTFFVSKLYLKPKQLLKLVAAFQEQLKTDLDPQIYGQLFLLARRVNWEALESESLDERFLTHPRVHSSKQWVLVPKGNDWSEIRNHVDLLLE